MKKFKNYKEIRKAVYDACERAGIKATENNFGIAVQVDSIGYTFEKKANVWTLGNPASIADRENDFWCSYDTAFDTMLHHMAGIFTEAFVRKTCFVAE